MGTVERQVKIAQRRLWFNRWLRQWGWTLVCAIVAWLITWILDRLFALRLPMGWIALGGLAVSLVSSVIWLARTREPPLIAAAVLDEAAGFKERIATGLQMSPMSEDPFERAVIADAERVVAGLSARRFIPLRWTGSLSVSSMILVVALLSLLLPEFDILGKDDAAAQAQSQQARLTHVRTAVAKPVSVIQKIIEDNPELRQDEDMKSLEDALKRPTDVDPDVLRRTALKQIDRVQNALEKEVASDRFKALAETKKRLSELGRESETKMELGRLMEDLAEGRFEEAQQAVQELQEKLAQRSREGKVSPEQMDRMKKELKELEKKLESLAQDKQSEQELQNAGLSQAEAKRILDTLAKKDPKQIDKLAKELSERLKKEGVTEEQMKEMLQKMQQRQKACQQCKKMGSQMGQAAEQMEQGDMEGASSELGEAAEMLSEMEMLEQAMNELETQMSDLDNARDEMNQQMEPQPCPHCNGTGFQADGSPCPWCRGTGQGSGSGQGDGTGQGGGRGTGKRDRDDNVQTASQRKKAEAKISPGGRIIGQRFVKGRQLKGETSVDIQDAASAAEVEATDALNRDRIPRQYRKGVRNYFDRLGRDYQGPKSDSSKDGASKPEASKGEASEGQSAAPPKDGEDGAEQAGESSAAQSPETSADPPAETTTGEK